MTDQNPQPLHPENPDHAGETQPDVDDAETDDGGTSIDPLDPLKREGEQDPPGLDPVVPIIPSD